MSTTIRLVTQADPGAVARLSLAAWQPNFESFERILGTEIYRSIWPQWRKSQREAVEDICRKSIARQDEVTTWVAVVDGDVAGFTAVKLNRADKSGEIEFLAVSPLHQGQGIGKALSHHALEFMASQGTRLAVVETGGDEAHAAARTTYERAGFKLLPIVRGYVTLSPDEGK
jgi:ribosomal protein S18 acetylase RimI-like enzyme